MNVGDLLMAKRSGPVGGDEKVGEDGEAVAEIFALAEKSIGQRRKEASANSPSAKPGAGSSGRAGSSYAAPLDYLEMEELCYRG